MVTWNLEKPFFEKFSHGYYEYDEAILLAQEEDYYEEADDLDSSESYMMIQDYVDQGRISEDLGVYAHIATWVDEQIDNMIDSVYFKNLERISEINSDISDVRLSLNYGNISLEYQALYQGLFDRFDESLKVIKSLGGELEDIV